MWVPSSYLKISAKDMTKKLAGWFWIQIQEKLLWKKKNHWQKRMWWWLNVFYLPIGIANICTNTTCLAQSSRIYEPSASYEAGVWIPHQRDFCFWPFCVWSHSIDVCLCPTLKSKSDAEKRKRPDRSVCIQATDLNGVDISFINYSALGVPTHVSWRKNHKSISHILAVSHKGFLNYNQAICSSISEVKSFLFCFAQRKVALLGLIGDWNKQHTTDSDLWYLLTWAFASLKAVRQNVYYSGTWETFVTLKKRRNPGNRSVSCSGQHERDICNLWSDALQ